MISNCACSTAPVHNTRAHSLMDWISNLFAMHGKSNSDTKRYTTNWDRYAFVSTEFISYLYERHQWEGCERWGMEDGGWGVKGGSKPQSVFIWFSTTHLYSRFVFCVIALWYSYDDIVTIGQCSSLHSRCMHQSIKCYRWSSSLSTLSLARTSFIFQ